MHPPRLRVMLAATLTFAAAVALAAAPEQQERTPTAAVERALPLIQKSALEYTVQRQCFSCHHQTMSMLALTTARERGFAIDPKAIQGQVAHTEAFLRGGRENYRQGRGQGGAVTTAGYGLWALSLGEWKGDDTTAAVAEYLIQRDAALGAWRPSTRRPPTEGSAFASTAVALLGLKAYGTAEQQARVTERLAKVREWLAQTPAQDGEDRVFRLWALRLAGAGEEEVQAAARQLLASQREDGGWSQDETSPSDAYATGSALVALHRAAGLPVADGAYRRGVAFLLKTQQEDGSWHVRTRSKPIQTHFETGFPHGTDQFISMAATCWATTALALACEKR